MRYRSCLVIPFALLTACASQTVAPPHPARIDVPVIQRPAGETPQ